MAVLQVLEESFSNQGFHVLGFYSNDFNQVGDPDSCSEAYGVTFDQFLTAPVTLPDAQPVFAWLIDQPNPGPATAAQPTWNFHKYLVSRTGELVGHWDQTTYPGDDPNDPNDTFDTSPVVMAIRAELALDAQDSSAAQK